VSRHRGAPRAVAIVAQLIQLYTQPRHGAHLCSCSTRSRGPNRPRRSQERHRGAHSRPRLSCRTNETGSAPGQ
jgi:hypothetical protein